VTRKNEDASIGYFDDHLTIDGNSYSWASSGQRPWMDEAYKCLHKARSAESIAATFQTFGLVDGIYLDPDELRKRGGLFIPLRTESQRWFHKVFAAIIGAQRKLKTNGKKRYVVLDEYEFRSLSECVSRLNLIESGIGKAGRPLRVPNIVANFRLHGDALDFGGENLDLPDDIKRMCRAVATDSIWGEGALVHKHKLKPWLARAFELANQGAQQVTDPHLVRIGDEQASYQWAPPLPNLVGKTREEVRLETSSRSMRRRRRSASRPEPNP
jgi:hypothetical protein